MFVVNNVNKYQVQGPLRSSASLEIFLPELSQILNISQLLTKESRDSYRPSQSFLMSVFDVLWHHRARASEERSRVGGFGELPNRV